MADLLADMNRLVPPVPIVYAESMPANLPPQYYELDREFKAETDNREKLRMARELLRMMPKHKGTDKLQAEMKAKISKLNKLIQSGEKTHGAKNEKSFDHIVREGARQIILIGAPNSGKSSLVGALTHAKPLVADYPYSTREPLTGMMEFETVQLQLIDTPPISNESFEPYLNNLTRQADLVLLVVDLAVESFLNDAELVIQKLKEHNVLLRPFADEASDDPRIAMKKMVLCGHKEYEDESGERIAALRERFTGYEIVATSIIDDDSLDSLKQKLFESLSIIRVYTKHVGEEAKLVDPVVLPIGGTVHDAARAIHKDIAAKLKFAKIWGEGKYDGQRVNQDFELHDRDIVEFHM